MPLLIDPTPAYPGLAYPGVTYPGWSSASDAIDPGLPVLIPPGLPSWVGARSTTYQVDILSIITRDIVGQVRGRQPGGSLDWTNGRSIQGAGSLVLNDTGQSIAWRDVALRVTGTVTDSGGEHVTPWGVFLPVVPEDDWSATGRTRPVTLLDITAVYDRAKLTAAFSMPPGSVVTDWVWNLLDDVGWPYSLTPSTATNSSEITFPAGTPYITVINALLDSIEYWSLHSDGWGTVRVEPYVAPGRRGRPVYRFESGSTCIFSPEWSRTQDWSQVPDEVVLTTMGDATTPGMVSVYVPAPPDGRPPNVYTAQVEASDQAALDRMAASTWARLQLPSASISIKHMPVPLRVNDLVWFRSARAGVDILCTVQSTRLPLGKGLMETVLQEVHQ